MKSESGGMGYARFAAMTVASTIVMLDRPFSPAMP